MTAGRGQRPLGRALREVIAPQGPGRGRHERDAPGAGLLAHPARAALFQFLLDRPLANVSQAAAAMRTTAPSARWHMAVLESAGVLQTRRVGRSLVACVPGTADGPQAARLEVLRRPRCLPFVRAVAGQPGVTVGQAARAIDTTPQSAARALAALRAVELVEAVRDGRAVRCYPGQGLLGLVEERSQATPEMARRVQAALEGAGEEVQVVRKARGEVTLAVGRRGRRREFTLRAEGPLLPVGSP